MVLRQQISLSNRISHTNIFSFLKLQLIRYLKKHHPQLIDDEYFIMLRSDKAADCFSRMIHKGVSRYKAYKEAKSILLENLFFSKYQILKRIYVDEYGIKRFTKKEDNQILCLLDKCDNIFQKYDLSDSFINSPEYLNLYAELKENIRSMR